jgi:hypothetical protein
MLPNPRRKEEELSLKVKNLYFSRKGNSLHVRFKGKATAYEFIVS